MLTEEANRGTHIFQLFRNVDVRGQPVIDRKPGDPRAPERFENRRNIGDLVTSLPPATVDYDYGGNPLYPEIDLGILDTVR